MASEAKKNVTLFLIDVQKDFHPPHGSLAVPNADHDAERIATLIKESMSGEKSFAIDRIVCTMDSHNTLHIAHRGFWLKGDEYKKSGKRIHPDPFTLISNEDVKNQVWIPRPDLKIHGLLGVTGKKHAQVEEKVKNCLNEDGFLDLDKWTDYYTSKLEENGKFQLIIWPEHCVMGTEGHTLVNVVRLAIQEWEMNTGKTAEFVMKGSQNLTEMYSVLEAEVPVCDSTSFNHDLFSALTRKNADSDEMWIAGQAASHCVNFTTRHLVSKMKQEDLGCITILTDCTSSVTGFEQAGETFFDDMKKRGVHLKTTEELL